MQVTFKTEDNRVTVPVKSRVHLGQLLSSYSKTYGVKGFVATIDRETMQSLGGFETVWGKVCVPKINYSFALKGR